MRKTRSKGRRVRRVTRKRGAGLGNCFGAFCTRRGRAPGPKLNRATELGLEANENARRALNELRRREYDAHVHGLQGQKPDLLRYARNKFNEAQGAVTEKRRNVAALMEENKLHNLERKLVELKRTRHREASRERASKEISNLGQRIERIKKMTREELTGKK